MERIFTEVSNGPHCASVLSQRFGFLAFALWAFNAPFPGTLTSTSLPALLGAVISNCSSPWMLQSPVHRVWGELQTTV